MASLDGEYGRVKVRDWGRSGRTPAGVPVVDGANQTGTQIQSKGWTPGTVVLRQGDYFTVNDELKMVTADVTSAANGTAMIVFAPMLRGSPPANAVIEIAKPYGIFKLKDNQQEPVTVCRVFLPVIHWSLRRHFNAVFPLSDSMVDWLSATG